MSGSTPALGRLDIEKFKLRLADADCSNAKRLAFLALSGALNPVHTQHIRALQIVRTEFERLGWTVVGGFLAPSDDHYVKSKTDKSAWSITQRIKLCEAATRESDWVDVCPWGEFSSNKVRIGLRDYLEHNCTALLAGRSLTGIEIMGSDTAMRILDKTHQEWSVWRKEEKGRREAWFPGRVIGCLIRPGPNSGAETQHLRKNTAPWAAHLGVQLLLIDTTQLRRPLEAVSSKDIRAFVVKRDWDGLRARGWLPPEVLRVLETWPEQ